MNTTTKGSRWRHLVAQWLELQECETSSRPWMQPGDDITASLGRSVLSVECKDQVRLDLPSWLAQAHQNAPAGSVPVVVAHRKGKGTVEDAYVILSGSGFALLLEGLR